MEFYSSMRPVRPTHGFAPKTKMPQTRFEPWGYPFGGSSPRSCPPLFRRHLGWRGCLESRISSDFSAICAPITGNRASGHSIYEVVRRGVKRRFTSLPCYSCSVRERVYLQLFQQLLSQDSSFYPSWQFPCKLQPETFRQQLVLWNVHRREF